MILKTPWLETNQIEIFLHKTLSIHIKKLFEEYSFNKYL